MSEHTANFANTTLNGASGTGTSITVTSSSGFPSANFRAVIQDSSTSTANRELVLVTNVSGTTWTVTRGIESTSNVNHADTSYVAHVLTAGGLDQLFTEKATSPADHFIVGQGGQNDSDLTAKIIIPGLSGSPDIRVAGANDDEFDTTDTGNPPSGWTAMGTLTAVDINSTVKSHLYMKSNAAAGKSNKGIYKSSPSQPFTVTAKLTDLNARDNYNQAGIFVGEATPGVHLVLGVVYNSSEYRIFSDKNTNPTSFGSTIVGALNQMTGRPPTYLRIVVTDDTHVAFYYSANGLSWNTLTTGYNPSITVASYGLYVDSENATYSEEAFFDWIRLT